jgi:TetR/AcrR family transcriptional regulator, transcriptional repressor for nem operon
MDAAYELIWEFSYGAVTVEAICDRAAVKKGSFYYFFDSKSDLAVAALDAWWVERKNLMENVFRTATSPTGRLRGFLEFIAARQLKSHEESGQILGCPICALGTEISAQDPEIRKRILIILEGYTGFFEEVIREAQVRGEIPGTDAEQKAQTLVHYYAGVLTLARISNDTEAIRQLATNTLELLGARESHETPVFKPYFVTPAEPLSQLVPRR